MPKRSDRVPTPPHPITMATLAKRIGVNRSTVTRVCRERLRPAVLPNGRVDARHPEVRRWARSRGVDPRSLLDPVTATQAAPEGPASQRAPVKTPGLDELPEVAALLDLTIREATTRFGSAQGARDWIALRRHAAEVARVEARTQREAGLLISRELVRQTVFGAFEALAFRLLRDMVDNLSARLATAPTREQRALMIRSEVTSHLTRTKQDVIRGLRASVVTGDHQPPAVQERENQDEVLRRDSLRREFVAELGDLLPDTIERIATAFPNLTKESERRRVVTAALRGMLTRAELISGARDRQVQAEKELHRDDDETT